LRDPNHEITKTDRQLFAESEEVWKRLKGDVQRLVALRLAQYDVNKKRNEAPESMRDEMKTIKAISYWGWIVATGMTATWVLFK